MEVRIDSPAFGHYAVCTAILVLKMIASAVYTGTRRSSNQAYVNPEDARTFGGAGTEAAPLENPAVAHALRIQRNDLENIPLFFAVGLIYVLSGASAFGAAVYCWTFAGSRIAHTIFYTLHMQPWRAISWEVGALCLVGMSFQVLLSALWSQ